MSLLKGKKGLIMGVANDRSIAWGIAKKLSEHGAELAFTFLGDALKKRVIPLAESLGSKEREGFNPGDVIYLITPDRYANGDPRNDSVDGLKERSKRNNKDGRHGGDIQGIIDHLGYIDQMFVLRLHQMKFSVLQKTN